MGSMAIDQQLPSGVHDPEWLEFEGLLSELARLAKSGIAFERLVRSLLDQTVHILAAAGGAVWLGPRSSPLRLDCHVNYDAIHGVTGQGFHQKLLEQARTGGETIVVPPGGVTIGSRTLSNPTDLTFLIGPLKVDHDVVGLIEVIQRPLASAAAVRGNRRMLDLVCELVADYLRRRELRELRDAQLRTQQFDEFTARIHSTLNPRAVAYELVNAGRDFIDCDRVSVAIRKGRRFRVAAISSVDSIDRRSNAVRHLEELAARVAKVDEIVWYDGENGDALAPQILESLRRFADDAHPRMVGLLPLKGFQNPPSAKRSPAAGVLIVEQFNSMLDHAAQERAARIVRPSGLALLNALRFQSLPTLPFARSRTTSLAEPAIWLSTLLAVLAGISVIASLLFVNIDFNVHAEGALQPEQQQQVFAPFDGQVASIAVQHGDQVASNDILLELRSPDIELESQRIQGDFATTQKRISAIESSLLQMNNEDDRNNDHLSQLATEQEELRQVFASQRKQLLLLREQREKLVLRSPIEGQVLTWDLAQLLSNRPVQRGQALLSVANLKGPWVAELKVPDDLIGYVLDAREKSTSLVASFQLATNRGVDYQGAIRRIATRTETVDNDRPVVRVTMDVDEKKIGELRPGATIFAEIHCGKRSVAYVLFHRLVEAVQSWIRF